MKTADIKSVARALYEHNWHYCHGNTDPYQENCSDLWKSWLPYARVAIKAHEKVLKEREKCCQQLQNAAENWEVCKEVFKDDPRMKALILADAALVQRISELAVNALPPEQNDG